MLPAIQAEERRRLGAIVTRDQFGEHEHLRCSLTFLGPEIGKKQLIDLPASWLILDVAAEVTCNSWLVIGCSWKSPRPFFSQRIIHW
ncbi:MAG TPA: hypothetical protein VI455_10875 [Terriglobia bacterium]